MANRKLPHPVSFFVPEGHLLFVNGKRVQSHQLQEMDAYFTLNYGRAGCESKDYNIMLFQDGKGFFDSLRLNVLCKVKDKESGQDIYQLKLPPL